MTNIFHPHQIQWELSVIKVKWTHGEDIHTRTCSRKHTHTPQSGLHGHVSSTSCKHYCVPGDRDHWNLIVWGNIRSAFHGESDKQCCERWPGQALSVLLCRDRCRLYLFFLLVLETGHPSKENDNKNSLSICGRFRTKHEHVFTVPA